MADLDWIGWPIYIGLGGRFGSEYSVDQHGCELDTDGDGVVNSEDYCPEDSKEVLSMGVAENGCPKHSDGDGVPDYRDRCPNTPAKVKTDKYGCETG